MKNCFPCYLALALFLILAVHVWAEITSAYFTILWLDIPMHFFGGAWVAAAAYYFFFRRENSYQPTSVPWMGVLFLVGTSALVGIFWEFFEYGADVLTERYLDGFAIHQKNLKDTLADLFFDIFGALSLSYYFLYLFALRKIQTLAMVENHPQILLGMKKRGFGSGRWNGFGGKVASGEDLVIAAKRELFEESGIRAANMEKRGILELRFKGEPEIMEVHVFHSKDFSGEPRESEEMKPQWFHKNEIPFDLMWPDDRHWLPMMLAGKKFRGKFLFDGHDNIIDKELFEVKEI